MTKITTKQQTVESARWGGYMRTGSVNIPLDEGWSLVLYCGSQEKPSASYYTPDNEGLPAEMTPQLEELLPALRRAGHLTSEWYQSASPIAEEWEIEDVEIGAILPRLLGVSKTQEEAKEAVCRQNWESVRRIAGRAIETDKVRKLWFHHFWNYGTKWELKARFGGKILA